MYSRIGTWEGTPEALERWIARSRGQVKPGIRRDPGLASAYWLVDRARGKGMIVTFWESREAMEAAGQARLKRQRGTAAATGAQVATERYEVVDRLMM